MNIITIIGARPQFIKAAVVSKAIQVLGIDETIIHTGQHYDPKMSDLFWNELKLPKPVHNLNVGSMPHGAQTAFIMKSLEDLLLGGEVDRPDALLVYGDTNSTLAGALVAAKMDTPVIHIEAGLRSFNREMPEEINRIVTDHLSSVLFCSSDSSVAQLAKEGITENVYVVGDVMLDAFELFSEYALQHDHLTNYKPFTDQPFVLLTVHRPSNTDNQESLREILSAIEKIRLPVIWPVHPRNQKRLSQMQIPKNLHLFEPASYFEMLSLLNTCSKVITDSGGLQKEAYWAKKPCITVREETEWVETLRGGWNQLTGPNRAKIVEAFSSDPTLEWEPLYGDGMASRKIARQIKAIFDSHNQL